MLNTDNLLALCEIAASLAGFSAIITVVDRGTNSESWVRLQSVILICLLVIAAALVPVLLMEYRLENHRPYGVAAVIFLALIWLTIFTVSRLVRKSGGNIWKNVSGLSSNLVMWSMEVMIQVPLVLCVLGWLPDYHSAFYLTALILNLFQAAQFFYMLVVESTIQPHNMKLKPPWQPVHVTSCWLP